MQVRVDRAVNNQEAALTVATSDDPAAPRCVHFGVCGGCQYQDRSYAAQLRLKAGLLQQIFAEAGLPAMPAAAVHAGEPWGYRNRVRLRVRRVEEALRVGYSQRGSNQFLPIVMCPIAAPVLWRAAETLLALAREPSPAQRWLDAVQEVELFTSSDETRLQANFFMADAEAARREQAGFAALCQAWQGSLPELTGAGAQADPELSRRVRRTWAGVRWGADGLAYAVAGRSYWVGWGSFFQVNRFLIEMLVQLATDRLAGDLAWDLFAGVGLFSRVLAERFERVVAVEGSEAAAAALAQAGRGGRGAPGFEAVRQPAVAFLAQRAVERDRPQLVLLDPPRAGLGAEGAALLARIRPAAIVYVSCDPVTLATDLRVLLTAGYRATAVHLIDLFPQTHHMETVVCLTIP